MKKLFNLLMLVALVGLASCRKDNEPILPPTPTPEPLVGGVYLLNEGNMTSEFGSLAFITPEGTYADNLFYNTNQKYLGNVTQDMYIANNRIYIISQNGDKKMMIGDKEHTGDGVLSILDARTHKSLDSYKLADFQGVLSWPTHLVVVGQMAYIRGNEGIATLKLDDANRKPVLINGTAGAAKITMVVVGQKVVAIQNSKRLMVLEDGKVSEIIDMGGAVSGVVRMSDMSVMVALETTPARFVELNLQTKANTQQELPADKPGLRNAFSARPSFSRIGNYLYYTNAGTKGFQSVDLVLYRHDWAKKVTEEVAKIKPMHTATSIFYNGLAVDPVTGYVYVAMLKGFGLDYLKNVVLVLDPKQGYKAIQVHENKTRFPAGIFPRVMI